MSKRKPSEEEFKMLDAMFSPNPEAWDDWVRSQGYEPDPDLPMCLAGVPKSEWVENSKVIPTPGIQAYLDSGDVLTHHTIEMMEDALDRAYQTGPEWGITGHRSGDEDEQTLVLEYFWLVRM